MVSSAAWRENKQDVILAIVPQAFTILLKGCEEDQRKFMTLFSKARVTVLFRMTPTMKLEIAKMTKRFLDGATCNWRWWK